MAEDFSEAAATAVASRRNVLGGAGGRLGVLAAIGAATLGGAALTSRKARAQTITPAEIFQFAINFEYLGAEYYLHAVTGQGLSSALTGSPTNMVNTNGFGVVPFQTQAVAGFAIRLASDEQAHVNFFRNTLTSVGATVPAEPVIDISVANWTTLAQAAGVIGAGQTFNPYANENAFLTGAYVLEDVCVTALAGAAAMLVGSPAAFINAAAGLLGVEAAQAGAIRGYLSQVGAGVATDKISALRAALSGVGDNGTDYNSNPYNITNTDFNALNFDRTPQQVLNVAYAKAGTGVTSGGFFPNGVAGPITST